MHHRTSNIEHRILYVIHFNLLHDTITCRRRVKIPFQAIAKLPFSVHVNLQTKSCTSIGTFFSSSFDVKRKDCSKSPYDNTPPSKSSILLALVVSTLTMFRKNDDNLQKNSLPALVMVTSLHFTCIYVQHKRSTTPYSGSCTVFRKWFIPMVHGPWSTVSILYFHFNVETQRVMSAKKTLLPLLIEVCLIHSV